MHIPVYIIYLFVPKVYFSNNNMAAAHCAAYTGDYNLGLFPLVNLIMLSGALQVVRITWCICQHDHSSLQQLNDKLSTSPEKNKNQKKQEPDDFICCNHGNIWLTQIS